MKQNRMALLALLALFALALAGCSNNGIFSQKSLHAVIVGQPPADTGASQTVSRGSHVSVFKTPIACKNDPKKKNRIAGATAEAKQAQAAIDEALDYCQTSQDFWQKGELENAVEALDHAYSLILDIDPQDDTRLVQQKEDLRFTISKRILEIYTSRNTMVHGMHNAIPIVINTHVQQEIDLLSKGCERDFFISAYKRSGRYRHYIVQQLKAAGMPEELSWLPLIESGFKVRALSRARALGLWQFIPSTGYKFGLKRDMYVDERLDFEKSTQAAIAYLKELHQIFGDWSTVLAAYNCGEWRVLKVIQQQNVNYLDNFWDLYQKLPRETARYVPRFLATLQIVKHLEQYGLADISKDDPFTYETFEMTKQARLKTIAKNMGISKKLISDLNPELRYEIIPQGSYPLRIPIGTSAVLSEKLAQIPAVAAPYRAYAYHKVRRGETLSTIARKYRTSVASILNINRIRHKRYIIAGHVLKIPQRADAIATKPAMYTVSSKSHTKKNHTVRSGDSLWTIAQRYHTTIQALQRVNHLQTTALSIGQKLLISAPSENASGNNRRKVYHVQSGDSPYSIATKNNMSLEHFLRMNRMTPRSTIYPDQTVYVD